MLQRVASIARRHADVDLALLWGEPGVAASEAGAAIDRLTTLGFPEQLRVSSAPSHRRAMRRFERWIAEPRADALVAFSFPIAVRAAVLAKRLGIPCAWVWQQSLPLFDSRLAGAKQWLSLRILRHSGVHIVCPTRIAFRDFAELGVPPSQLRLIRYGIDPDHFAGAATSETDKAAYRRARGIPSGDLVAVCVARIDPLKDHETLLRAVRRAADDGVRVSLVCVGGADAEGQEHARFLRERAEGLGVGDRVMWTGHQHDVRPWLGAADVAVLASRRECAPLALAEAGAAGLPLVATRVGGIPELVECDRTGLLFEPGDASGAARALCRLARDPRQRRAFGRAACARVREELDASEADALWSSLLAELIGGRA